MSISRGLKHVKPPRPMLRLGAMLSRRFVKATLREPKSLKVAFTDL